MTGIGVVAPNGLGTDAFWEACRSGRSGISTIDTFDTSSCPVKVAGIVRGFVPSDYLPAKVYAKTDRFVHLGGAAAQMALKDSGLDGDGAWRDEVPVVIGTGLGGQMFHEEAIAQAYRDGPSAMSPLCIQAVMPSSVPAYIAILHKLGGPNCAISTACSSGANAIGDAFQRVRRGDSAIAVTGGVEAPVTPFTVYAHCALKVLSLAECPPEEVSKPFDRRRAGFVIAEGAAMFVLEEMAHARARNAPIYAEIVGFATNSGAHHIAMPDPSARDLVRVMNKALADAAIGPGDIDYVNAHGTGTVANDSVEISGLERVLGPRMHEIRISASKSMIGHSLGAAGALEGAICVLSLHHQWLTPTLNLHSPEFEYDFVPHRARRAELEYVMSNSFGFGSNNACLIFRRYHAN